MDSNDEEVEGLPERVLTMRSSRAPVSPGHCSIIVTADMISVPLAGYRWAE